MVDDPRERGPDAPGGAAVFGPIRPNRGAVRTIGHRGCADEFPENTVAAIEGSASHVDMFEIDVQACGTGELVVFHDETLERVTDATGRVGDTPFGELRELEVLDSGEPIPTLAELLAAVPPEIPVNVELKGTGIAGEVLEVCRGSDVDVLYSSFFESEIRTVRALDESAPVGVLCHESPETCLELAAELDAVAVHPPTEMALETDFVDAAHERGLAVYAWVANAEAEIRGLRDRGVDGIFTDRCDAA
ncbi:MAG: glycerophosphodiester phosphodiesterase [Haloferacaceae archaeon]